MAPSHQTRQKRQVYIHNIWWTCFYKRREIPLPIPHLLCGELLSPTVGQMAFQDFLRTEYSEENLMFWLACQEYKKNSPSSGMEDAAQRIYSEFVQVDAPRQINIDCATREEISRNICRPGPHCFDRAEKVIHRLMENDCYPRFVKSEIYRVLQEQLEQP
uniref:Regulator of G-protein signaling 1 n=1 Tax=Gouania willdenowi TaxID=441366 RepID=A0A8C5DYJ6_GOUWI